MRFNLYPLDTQICIFRFGSFAYHNDQMTYKTNKLILNHKGRAESAVSDYSVSVSDLPDVYKLYLWEEGLNITYSIAGFQMKLMRHSMKYFFNYYLPSGLFTVVSWVDKSLRLIILFKALSNCSCLLTPMFCLEKKLPLKPFDSSIRFAEFGNFSGLPITHRTCSILNVILAIF